MVIKAGMVAIIYGPLMYNGIITRLVSDVHEYTSWDPYTRILHVRYLPEFKMSTFNAYFHNGMYTLSNYVNSKMYTFNATLINCSPNGAESLDNDYPMNSTIIIGDHIYGARRDTDDLPPITISEGWLHCMSMSAGRYTIYIDSPIKVDIKDLVYIYDSGYPLSSWEIFLPRRLMVDHMYDTDLIYRFYLMYKELKPVDNVMIDIKKRANNLIVNDDDMEEIHMYLHLVPDYMKWFFIPDGYHRSGYKTDYQMLIYKDSINLEIVPGITHLLLSMMNIIPYMNMNGDIGITTYFDMQSLAPSDRESTPITYELPMNIKEMLKIMNRDETKVVIAGGFIITKGDYDLFILDGKDDTAKRVLELLNISDYTYSRGIYRSSDDGYQVILSNDLKTPLDVLYSFDLSHCMVAHDGEQFICTPEFLTFTSANLSLLTLPMTRVSRLHKIIKAGYTIVHPHTGISPMESYEGDIDQIDEYPSLMPLGNFYGSSRDYTTSTLHGRDIDLSSHIPEIMMNVNGINEGYIDLEPDTRYSVEHNGTYIFSIRELA